MRRPLDGIRVIDLSRFLSGPFCTQLLADYGADVIGVESPRGRELRPAGARDSYFFLSAQPRQALARARLPAARRARGAGAPARRARTCWSRTTGRACSARSASTPHELLRRHPRLIVCSISGFGADGPYARRPGFDPIAQGMSGLMSLTGTEESGPTRVGIAISDLLAGIFAAHGIQLALLARAQTRARPARGHLAARGDDRRAVVGRGHVLREREEPGARRATIIRSPRRPAASARATAISSSPPRTTPSSTGSRSRSGTASGCSTRASRTCRRAWRTGRRCSRRSRRCSRRDDVAYWVSAAQRGRRAGGPRARPRRRLQRPAGARARDARAPAAPRARDLPHHGPAREAVGDAGRDPARAAAARRAHAPRCCARPATPRPRSPRSRKTA